MNPDGDQPSAFELGDRPELFERPAIYLSASVPYRRSPKEFETAEQDAENQYFVATAQPLRIREAIAQLCRFAFSRDIDLVFGGHPAISPIVLVAARRFGATPRKRVIVFQSLFFWSKIPQETLNFEDWELGTLLWTAPQPTDAPTKEASLTWMRKLNFRSPQNLLAAVFVGGMEGCIEEADIATRDRPTVPRFAIGSTGSAAADLLDKRPGFSGSLDSDLLQKNISYPIVMRRIFESIGCP
jgi:hypothetical protein